MNIKRMIRVSLFAAFLAVSVYLLPPIAVPIIDVSITLQTLFVMLIGFLLSPVEAFLSVFVYVLLGAIGLPVFSGLRGGIQPIIGPTGGFIVLFPVVAYLISKFKSKVRNKPYDLMIGFLFGVVMLYLLATIWLSFSLGLAYFTALSGMMIFIPFDIVKLLIAYAIYLRLPREIIQ
jgi:biotin transport system substrate-specific component